WWLSCRRSPMAINPEESSKMSRKPLVHLTAALALVPVLVLAPALSGAATQEELEARVQSLADQLKEVQAELAELRKQRGADSARNASALPDTGPQAARNASALPEVTSTPT